MEPKIVDLPIKVNKNYPSDFLIIAPEDWVERFFSATLDEEKLELLRQIGVITDVDSTVPTK